ncbi:MAG: GGDEF domain-containing protein [Eubacterium sp.]|nr:GGDEF domain-containing protein [Eubacterium sp.]
MSLKKRNIILLVIAAFLVIGILIGILYFIQVRTNKRNAFSSNTLLINQIKSTIDNNDDRVRSLTASLKEDYITRARAVSYIIDKNPTIEKQITELAWIANLVSVDEIHLLDPQGEVYSGTKPAFYGHTMEDDPTLQQFQKMLTEKNFTMCIELTTDVENKKPMMYAMCWNDAKERLVMVGIKPMRLLNELSVNEMDAVIKEFPAYDGVEIFVAGDTDNKIDGATNERYIGKDLFEIGFEDNTDKLNVVVEQDAVISNEDSYCSMTRYNNYKIAIARYRRVAQEGIYIPLLLTTVYMIIAAVVLVLIVRRMTVRLINEQKNANSDSMTMLSNRRAYETDIRRYDDKKYEDLLVYVSMDLNGLKTVNDNRGHEAGDELIKGAADCMRRCFGNYGELYRIGGDEFAALIFADIDRLMMIKLDFSDMLESWTLEHGMTLAVSCGYVRASEYPELTIQEIAAMADDKMYEAKNEYYKNKKLARRTE